MTKKTMMRVRLAVDDYQRMFPEEYQGLMKIIQGQRDNLKDEYATVGAQNIKRALFSISEKLSQMIAMKLTDSERQMFKEVENQRWFCKQFPQFALTKQI